MVASGSASFLPVWDAMPDGTRAYREARWALAMGAFIVLLLAMIVFTGVHFASTPPSRVEIIDATTLAGGLTALGGTADRPRSPAGGRQRCRSEFLPIPLADSTTSARVTGVRLCLPMTASPIPCGGTQP